MYLSKFWLLILLITAFAGGFIVSQIKSRTGQRPPSSAIHEVRASGYKFISPLLRVDLPAQDQDPEVTALKKRGGGLY